MNKKRTALQFIILLGVVSLFADITYEGARSITGQYLATLGASGLIVGTVAGFGECVGHGFRLVSGYLGDRLKKYWLFTFVGYAINLLAVPLKDRKDKHVSLFFPGGRGTRACLASMLFGIFHKVFEDFNSLTRHLHGYLFKSDCLK